MDVDEVGERPQRIRRRTFLDYSFTAALAALAGAVLYPVVNFLIPPKTKEVTSQSVVAAKSAAIAANSGKIFALAGKPAIVLRTPDGGAPATTATTTSTDRSWPARRPGRWWSTR